MPGRRWKYTEGSYSAGVGGGGRATSGQWADLRPEELWVPFSSGADPNGAWPVLISGQTSPPCWEVRVPHAQHGW